MNGNRTPVAIVMPCLNEASSLRSACQSLGFGLGQNADLLEQCLVIVDNGSNDDSFSIAQEVARTSPQRKVFVVVEEDRGHVPARAKGVIAAEYHSGPDFIIQADADTEYGPGYAMSLWSSGKTHGPGTLVEAQMDWPHDFFQQNGMLINLIAELDKSFGAASNIDVVVDDKGCGYWLRDYETWGGHCREYWSSGEEMLAETTRLFIRGRAHGARRAFAEGATARHSTRNWDRNAEVELASAGFPMPLSWQKQWRKIGLHSLLAINVHSRKYTSLSTMRRKALAALFVELPKLVEESLLRHSAAEPALVIEAAMRITGVFS